MVGGSLRGGAPED
jgi:hypothetical protein